jgi:hypothetical protein
MECFALFERRIRTFLSDSPLDQNALFDLFPRMPIGMDKFMLCPKQVAREQKAATFSDGKNELLRKRERKLIEGAGPR